MEYRILPHGEEKISVIGMGMGSIHNASTAEVKRTVDAAIDAGINHFDYIPSDARAFEGYVQALAAKRDKVRLQVHIGADYSSGKYGWTTKAKLAIAEFEKRLSDLRTDYADFGFIHCIDEESDLDKVMNGGIWDNAQSRKADGTIAHLAFSTHTVPIARKLIATGAFDLAMFSINPMYDYTDESVYGKGEAQDRHELYRTFENAGVGLTVMKAFADGQLLDAKQSPFGIALSKPQLIQYALDKPGVMSVLPGVRGYDDLQDILAFLDASERERDYSALGTVAPKALTGSCVYCNHCQPCPQKIQIGLVNKYYDLACLGDQLAMEHYRTLEVRSNSCIQCGHCDERCPFGVKQGERMKEIAAYFERLIDTE